MAMTLDDLIQLLDEFRDEHGGDTEVRLMTQANWPFENAIAGVTSTEDINNENDPDDEDDEGEETEESETNYVYIVEGGQLCYGTKTAWDCCRDC